MENKVLRLTPATTPLDFLIKIKLNDGTKFFVIDKSLEDAMEGAKKLGMKVSAIKLVAVQDGNTFHKLK